MLEKFKAWLATVKPQRMIWTLLITILLWWLIAGIDLDKILLALYKLMLCTAGAYVGYWIDREAFPGSRPDCPDKSCTENAAALIRRALIMSAIIIGVSVGI